MIFFMPLRLQNVTKVTYTQLNNYLTNKILNIQESDGRREDG